ncbi:MAG: hypothetical protein JRF63_01120 [Deltaproteobacteria bacterium]|nr:hypothetical protein [Deltaproteobacteria bacterium]
MNEISKIHLLVGVKAEQSLRDSVRGAVDDTEVDTGDLELVPVGRKDWVAGVRAGSDLPFSKLQQIAGQILSQLIALDSRQRIRQENVRVYSVQPPVPVFKDPEEIAPTPAREPGREPAAAPQQAQDSASTCPVCQRKVHAFNLQHDTTGRVVGCYICGGDRSRAGS